MKVFILYANPVVSSFGAALHEQVIGGLRVGQHQIDDCDLYAENFDPVISSQERLDYHDPQKNRAHISSYADRLLWAQGLVLVYPVWNEGFPAILKGFFDRVFIPGVSFKIGRDGEVQPNLEKITRIGAVCTYGANRLSTLLLGDPPRRVVKRLVRAMPGHHVKCDYIAHYDMNHSTLARRTAFMEAVKRVFEKW